MIKTLITCAIASVALLASAPAFATTFLFTGGNSNLSGAAGNSQLYNATVGSMTVTATAWSTQTISSDLPTAAYLGKYSSGLGVTNGNEGNGSNNTHTTDNVGRYDFVRLVFSTPVQLTAATLQGFSVNSDGHVDTDAWVSYNSYGTNSAFNTTALWGDYLTNGTYVANGNSFNNTHTSTVWLIGAARSATYGDFDDGFKLSSVSVTAVIPAIPEPSTWMMMLLGFGGIGFSLRRRTVNAKAVPLLQAA